MLPSQTPARVQGPGSKWPRLAWGCPQEPGKIPSRPAGPAGESGAAPFLEPGSALGPLPAFERGAGRQRPPGAEAARHGGRGSPVLLPRVTPASVGLPQLGGQNPDDVDEEDEVELREGGRAACILRPQPQQGGARTLGPTAPPTVCSAKVCPQVALEVLGSPCGLGWGSAASLALWL